MSLFKASFPEDYDETKSIRKLKNGLLQCFEKKSKDAYVAFLNVNRKTQCLQKNIGS